MMQGEQENSGEEEVGSSPTPAQITEAAGCDLPARKGTEPYG